MKVKVKTSVGNFEISLFTEKAPITTTNFVSYIEDGFYVNTIFHRVIDGFMIQGGGFTEEMEEKPTRKSIQNEADNGLLNKSLTIAMARTSDPNSATAQFFINLMDNSFLNFTSKTPEGWGYAVFGEVTKGKNVVYKIGKSDTRTYGFYEDVPVKPIVIENISI